MIARLQKIESRLRGKRPVVVFTRAVDPLEGLFVQKADKTVALRYFFHDLHRQLVIVHGDIGGVENGRKLVLGGSHLVVLGLGEDAVRPERFVQIVHIFGNAGLQNAEIMIFKLLSSGRGSAEQRSARQNQIFPLFEHRPVHEEIFLFGSDRRRHLLAVDAKQFENTFGGAAYRGHRFQKRRFFIQRFARIGNENGGNVERSLFDEGGRGGIPSRIAARRAGGAGAARRKGRRVGLPDDQRFSRQLHDDAVAAARLDKAVVLLRRQIGERLKPMGVMGGAFGKRPVFHGVCHRVGYGHIDGFARVDGLAQGFVNFLGK